MNTAEKLKPCPFCGGAAILQHIRAGHRVCCDNPECIVSPEVVEDSPDEAIAAWNTRAVLHGGAK